MKNHKLTVVIPTYNRCNDLDVCLHYVVPQVEPYKDRVHIYISDNASTDNTKAVVKGYMDKHPDMITYYCQPCNITASPNFNHAVHNVNSEFIYMLSDDDIIVPGFISLMLGYMSRYKNVNYYYLNQYVADMDMHGAFLYNSRLTMDYVTLYDKGGELIKEYLNGPSCISANLFRREVWIDAVKEMKEDCPGYVWLSILFHGVVRTENVAVVNYPMFTARMPVVQRYSANWPWYYVKGLGQLFTYLDEIHPGIYKAWIQRQQKEGRRQFMMMLCGIAIEKKLYRERAREIKPFIQSSFMRVLYDCLVTVIPGWFAVKVLKPTFRVFKIFSYIKM
jgi:glycosyltransferase involved in cell wall biosynthesis